MTWSYFKLMPYCEADIDFYNLKIRLYLNFFIILQSKF